MCKKNKYSRVEEVITKLNQEAGKRHDTIVDSEIMQMPNQENCIVYFVMKNGIVYIAKDYGEGVIKVFSC